nr:MAG TPA: hypothetical protein [Caudoviricetes sp.]
MITLCLRRDFNGDRGASPSLPPLALPQRYSAIPPRFQAGRAGKMLTDRVRLTRGHWGSVRGMWRSR